MASNYNSTRLITLIAGADLRPDSSGNSHVGRLLMFDGNGRLVVTAGATDVAVGILAMEPQRDVATTGLAIGVAMLQGVFPVAMKTAVTAGHLLVPAADGYATAVGNLAGIGTGGMSVGVALETNAGTAHRLTQCFAQPMAGSA